MDNMQTTYANNSIKLGNDLIHLSKKLKSKFPNLNSGMAIYTLLSFFSMSETEIEEWNVSAKEITDIKNTLHTLPIFFHQNVLRLFNDRFYKEVIENSHLITYKDAQMVAIENSLLESCQEYQAQLKLIPSPFEVIYLYCELGIDIKDQWKNAKKDEMLFFLNSADTQHKIINDFCNQFEEKFSKELKQGIIND
ncbi:hypothetical protein FP435_00320 (plasmid) [Lactobacillus sp. PV037]|uniref:hypothetical protein n=1 Tax=Lactobacillus sp. PV037 TaxID=2594496 RepID=UPI00223ED8B0|nr:hypothetical protein [Lactobacillus sp. PV037]QNQ82982.1 hypothetical protein FP435_00320 [Lactobacillus sp. PV037]